MKYFTIKELCKSSIGKAKNINNTPDSKILKNLEQLVDNILDPLRKEYGKPIIVNSGYRCPALNAAVGGSKTSHHMLGLAADITAGSSIKNKQLFDLIQKLDLPYDQLIDEKHFQWVHVSFSENPRKQILHL